MSKKCLITVLIMIGFCASHTMGQALVPLDPATITDGHVYLLEDETDSSANSNTGIIAGAPLVVDGLSGKAMQFNGTSDGIQTPSVATINLSTHQNKTVIAVFNCADVSKPEKQVVFEEGGTTRGMNIYVHEGLAYAGGWNPADYTPQWPGTYFSAPIGSGEWHVVVGVLRDGGAGLEDDKFEMWMDGVLIGKGPGAELRSRSNDCAIGRQMSQTKFHDGNVSATGSYFEGMIDELWILNAALTPDELSAIGFGKTNAKNPIPEDGTTDVWRTSTLAWDAGEFAQTHNVYVGTNPDDVNNATTGVSMGQTDTTYDPGILAFDQTYYWRVDEVNGAPDRTVFKGDVWSFTVEPTGIPVTNITATASGENPSMGPENTINGSGLNAAGEHSDDAPTMWLAMGAEVWIQYEFDQAYPLHEMRVWNSNQLVEAFIGFGIKDALVETSTDAVNWTAVEATTVFGQGTGQSSYTANTTVALSGTVAQYVKITGKSAYGLTGQMGLSEVAFSYIPTVPRELSPQDASMTAGTEVTLSWRPGRQAASHQVSLGMDPANLTEAGTTNENSLITDPLDYDQTYYWQIVAMNDVETPATYASTIQSFNTPPYGTVDDFETYSGDADQEVFMTWFDGFGSDTSLGGSTTGHIDGPFVDTTVVYDGDQSMPVYINNDGNFFDIDGKAGSPNFSEVVRELAPAQDWTTGGIKTLSIMFAGSAGLSGQLYCKLGNTKLLYDGDTSNLSVAAWQPWNIDLSKVGGNLTNVRELAIGVEGGTSGILYIDAIRLYPQIGEMITPALPGNSDPNLVAYYEFEGNGDDTTGNYHGTVEGGTTDPTYTAGKSGQAINLDEIDDQVVYLFPVEEIWPAHSVCLWAKTDLMAQNVNSSLFSNSINTTSGFQIDLDGTDPGNYRYHGSVDSLFGPATSAWIHIGVSCDGTRTDLYYSGVLVGTINVADSNFTKLAMGVNRATDNWFGGTIDDVRIYNRALSAAEIAGLADRTGLIHKPF